MDLYTLSYTRPPYKMTTAGTRPKSSVPVPNFGSSPNIQIRSNEKAIFETYIPRPVKFFQRCAAELNRFLFFNTWLPIPGMFRNEFKFADIRSRRILSNGLPKDAGVVLVGAHPDRKDGNLLCEIYRQANQYPASVLISSEMIQRFGSFIHPALIKIVKPIFSMMGMVPLNRGARNPQVKNYTIQSITNGKWNSVFPEGDVRMGPRVFPMQKGAVEMAIKAAIQSKFKRPIMLVPFAHVWTYRDPEKAEKNFLKALETLEDTVINKSRGHLQDAYPNGGIQERVFGVGKLIMDYKLQEYRLREPETWAQMDFFERAEYLRTESLTVLEKKYKLPSSPDRIEHNRLMKIRSAAWEKLAALPEARRQKNLKWFDDIKCTQELAYMSTFKPQDIQDYGDGNTMDREMLASYVLQLSALMKVSARPLGDRVATVKVMDPIDIRKAAKTYDEKQTQKDKDQYAIQLTQELFQEPIQQEINLLRKKAILWKKKTNSQKQSYLAGALKKSHSSFSQF